MQGDSKLQSNRREFKYLVEESTAEGIRDYVRMYLRPDRFTQAQENGSGYPVHSLYLDSPDLKLCRQTICGEKNRFKLRVRFYDDSPSSPVFLEVKRRVYDTIQKQRVAVQRASLRRLFAGYQPDRSDMVESTEENYKALTHFSHLKSAIRAQPTAYTSYEREAYEPADHHLFRVTFDRNIRAGEFYDELSVAKLDQWPRAPIDGVVVELKFTDQFPQWMHKLAQLFNLQRISVPKYVECMNVVETALCRRQGTAPRIVVDRPTRIASPTTEHGKGRASRPVARRHVDPE